MTRIFFVIPGLYSGGAERVFLSLLHEFNRLKFEITLVLLIPMDGHFYKFIPDDIRVIQFKFRNTRSSMLTLFRVIRREKPDIVLSTLSHLNLIMAIIRTFSSKKILFVARESNTVSSSYKNEKFPLLFKTLFKVIYKKLDLIVCQSVYMKSDLIKHYSLYGDKIKVIYNPVNVNRNLIVPNTGSSGIASIKLISIGRLESQKGFSRLLKIMGELKDFPCQLRILGDGSLREELLELRKALFLEDKVEFLGIQPDPLKFILESHCLLLTSHYEGLPNVVLEAHACGLPVIAFNSPGGTRELIEDNFNGWLVEDGDINEFVRLIRAKKYLDLDKIAIQERTQEKYNLKKITRQYENEILNALRT